MSFRVEFWFDFASTYSYPAAMRLERLTRISGVEVAWEPFLLGPIFQGQGWHDSPFKLYPAKGQYMWRDLERTCAALGLGFKRPSVFPRNTVLASRVALAVAKEPWRNAFIRSVYTAHFAHDRDISDPTVIDALLRELGVQGPPLRDLAQNPVHAPKLRAQVDRAKALGIFGAPTFVSDGEIFWGNDRLEQALAWATRDRKRPRPGG